MDSPPEIVLSGIQPTGGFHIGNYLGAVQNWVRLTETPGYRCFFCIVDLHALTQDYQPGDLPGRVVEMTADLLASGLDPERASLFVQSHVPEHAELAWALATVTPFGELGRMTQFKDKSEHQPENINAGLFTYPILMAADILLYKATRVPVGHDQVQHLELTREIARRWNARFGETFPEPQPIHTQAPKILGLDGKQKMSKSLGNTILVSEEPEAIKKKLLSAYTDETRLRKSDFGHPDKCYVCGLHNYFSPADVTARHHEGCATATLGCVDSKRALAESMIAYLAPIRERSLALRAHPERIREILQAGAASARSVAIETMSDVRERLGLYR
ncbi:MAG: tryptophan--tRNA ligase [Myxococcales bacterium]|nr:tryptophan--tRNA ligase [Myxococcales bacterium]